MAVATLAALVVGGATLLVVLGVPVWIPFAGAVLVVGLQYLVNPTILEWLIPAHEVPFRGGRYVTDHVIGDMLARRCRDAGLAPVRLGIVDDGTPNAFTFGHSRKDARIYVTRGL